MDDIYYAIWDTAAALVQANTRLTSDTPGGDDSHYDPDVSRLAGNRALLVWTRGGVYGDICYAVLNSSGAVVKAVTNLVNDGTSQWDWGADAAQLSSGRAVVAWTTNSNSTIRYAVLDGSYNRVAGPSSLNNPAALLGSAYVSVAAARNRAVLTWMDADGSHRPHLYYALLDGDGTVVTPPMVFYRSLATSPYVETSYYGYGNTSHTPATAVLQQGLNGYAGSEDTYIYIYTPDTNYCQDSLLYVGYRQQDAALLRFDLSPISLDAVIMDAALQVYASGWNGTDMSLEAYAVLRNVSLCQTTWNQALSGNLWAQPGCNDTSTDRRAVPEDTVITNGPSRWYEFDLTSLVRQWFNGTLVNNGVILRGASATSNALFSLASAQSLDAALRPRLIISYRRGLCGLEGDRFEPNNDPAHATAISCTHTISATIDPAGDLDYYRFTGEAGSTIIADIDARVYGSPLDSMLTLFDSDGVTVLAANDDFGGIVDSHIEYRLPHAGTFYLMVQDYGTPDGGPDYSYALSLACVPPPDIQVTPPSFDVRLSEGGTASQTMTIDNTGLGLLSFWIGKAQGDPAPALASLRVQMSALTTAPSEGVTEGPPPGTPKDVPAREFLLRDVAVLASSSIDVLLVYADYFPTWLQAYLGGFPDIATVDTWDAHASVPILSNLTPYDVVIAWNNMTWADPDLIGDVLADYHDSGGHVILAVDCWSAGDFRTGGRLITQQYSPFSSLGGAVFDNVTLGWFDAAHPLMDSVRSAAADFHNQVALNPGAVLVAAWNDGMPFVATKQVGGRQIVAINAHFMDWAPVWPTDAPLIVHNAIVYVLTGEVLPWLAVNPNSGTVNPGQSQAVNLAFSAIGLSQGDYTGSLVIRNDDPDENPVTVPVTLHVSIRDPHEPNDDPAHATVISCTHGISATIDPAGDVDYYRFACEAGWTIVADIDARMNGSLLDSVLTLFDSDGVTVLAENDDFGGSLDSHIEYRLPHAGTFYLRVRQLGGAAGGLGYFYDLSLDCIAPPDIQVAPRSFEVTLLAGQVASRTMTISNVGPGLLTFDVFDIETHGPSSSPNLSPLLELISQLAWPEGDNNCSGVPGKAPALAGQESEAAAYRCAGVLSTLNILVYADDAQAMPGSTYVEQALQRLGYAYTGYYADPTGFGTALVNATWDLVVVSHDNWFALGTYWSELESYFNSGGKLIIATFDMDGSNSEATTLWNTLGTAYSSDLSTPANVYKWDSGHPVWSGVPNFTTWSDDYLDDGDRISVVSGSTGIGGFATTPTAGQVAIAARNDRRAIVNSFIIDEHRTDDDGDGVLDAVELWKNEITYVLGAGGDAAWLTESPTFGSLVAGDSGNVNVWFDTTALSLGDYTADIIVFNNDPFEPRVTVPVTLHVSGGVRLYLAPPTMTTYVSNTFTLDVMVDAGAQPVNNVELYIHFDPTYLRVVDAAGNPSTSIQPDLSALDTVLLNTVDNGIGNIRYDAGRLVGTMPTGTFRVATIRFHAVAQTVSTTVAYVAPTDVFYAGGSVLDRTESASVRIEPGWLIGRVTLQSHATAAGYTVRVSLFSPGGGTPIATYTTTLDATGTFTLTGIPSATYDVQVKGLHSLSTRRAGVTVPTGATAVNFCTLPEGDANDDDRVSGTDFSILATAYNKCTGAPGFDPRADFNDDGCVRGADFSLLASNYNHNGPVSCTGAGAPRVALPELRKAAERDEAVRLLLLPSSETVAVGETFTTDLVVELGTQALNNVELYLEFDPAVLMVVDASGNPATAIEADLSVLDAVLMNEVDARSGRIRYDAGRLSGRPPSETFRVATVRFKKTAASATTIRYARPSDAFYRGDSVVGSLGSAMVFSVLPKL